MRRLSAAVFLVVMAIGPLRAWSDPAPTPTAAPVKKPRKTNWTAEIMRKPSPTGGISDLVIADSRVPVTLMPKTDKLRPLVEVRGSYERAGWHLYVRTPAGISEVPVVNSQFKVYAYLNGRLSNVDFVAKGPTDETQEEQVLVFSPDAQEFRIGALWGEVLVSLGGAGLSYSQTNLGTFVSQTGLLALDYTSPSWWSNLGALASVRMTVWTVRSSPSAAGPELLQGKLDGTFLLPFFKRSRVQVTTLAGVSYLTLLANGSPFGFANLVAPDFGLRTRYTLNPNSALIGDLRYVPIGSLFKFTECGFDLSLAWSRVLGNLHRIELGTGYSRYQYSPDTLSHVNTGLLSLRLGYTI